MSSFMFEKYNALDSTSLNGRLTSVLTENSKIALSWGELFTWTTAALKAK